MGKKEPKKPPARMMGSPQEVLAEERKPKPLPKGVREAIADTARDVETDLTSLARAVLDYERERMADELASIIGDWPHGLSDLEALEARCRRGEP